MRSVVVLSLFSLLALPLAVSADVIYDTLGMIVTQTYDTANGDAWSGQGVFGNIYDLMVADDIKGTGGVITNVVGAYVTFFGGNPADGLYVATFADTGGAGPNNVVLQDGFFASRAESFRDTIFGLLGVYVGANINGALDCPDGLFWITIQPKDLTPQGDWYYIARDLDSTIGQDAYLRDGGRGNPGYGFSQWKSAGNAGFGAGDSAIRVECVPIPEPATLSLLGLAAVPFIRRRK